MVRLLLFAVLLWPLAAAANDERAQSAFQSAARGDWGNARAHARKSGDDILVKLMTWQYLLDAGAGASFSEIEQFIADNPKWPESKKLRARAEQSLRDSKTSDAEILRWFADAPPITGAGKIALAQALMRSPSPPQPKIDALVREAWKDGDFEEAQEKEILSTFGKLLTQEDHAARASRLLWEEKLGPAKRMLKHVDDAHEHLIEARMALIAGKRTAIWAEAKVPKSLHADTGLLYDRIRYYARRNDDANVRALLKLEPEDVPYPEKWWRFRESEIRSALSEKKYDLANTLLDHHEKLEGRHAADSIWLKGWLQLEFLKDAPAALATFTSMYENVRYPASRSRAAYWAGRAAEASGDSGTAENWYTTASAWPTTFYGQIGIAKRYGSTTLRIPSPPEISDEEKEKFEQTELAKAVALCLKHKQRDTAARLISFMIETSDDAGEIASAAKLGVRAGQWYLGVRGAKKAMHKGVALVESGYPKPDTPGKLPIERALALAVSRQESEFDPNAKSPSGALGLMQLRPGTAKEVSRKAGVGFNKSRLFEMNYNMLLGSHYLSRMINSYDGSYVMAIAAYNAGPGNVRKWVRKLGTPNNDINEAINWIEKIPFEETRNYVQRVLENLQVYRTLEDGDRKLGIAEDLVR